jgi:hypothetical protein
MDIIINNNSNQRNIQINQFAPRQHNLTEKY